MRLQALRSAQSGETSTRKDSGTGWTTVTKALPPLAGRLTDFFHG
jgi:hypothetical protein